MIPLSLQNKIALITGASQGLGAETARHFVQAGASVVINYFPDAEGINLSKAQRLCTELGPQASPLPGDVRSTESCQELINNILNIHGGLDILINNAGITRDRTLGKMEEAEWLDVIETNLNGVYRITRQALPCLREEGRIISLSSLSAGVGLFGQSNYAAAKAGLIGFTKVLSREVAKRKITVNAVAPGLVLTEMGAAVPETVRQEWLNHIPLKRFAEPSEIASVLLFLASPLASYITGQTLHVNGGWHSS